MSIVDTAGSIECASAVDSCEFDEQTSRPCRSIPRSVDPYIWPAWVCASSISSAPPRGSSDTLPPHPSQGSRSLRAQHAAASALFSDALARLLFKLEGSPLRDELGSVSTPRARPACTGAHPRLASSPRTVAARDRALPPYRRAGSLQFQAIDACSEGPGRPATACPVFGY